MKYNIFLRLKRRIHNEIKKNYYSKINPDTTLPPGTPNWFIHIEKHFGGYQSNVKRRKVSPSDTRSNSELIKGGMIGGDRMYHHGYAKYYSQHLENMINNREKEYVILEVGILKGTGLAIWSTLFPNSTIIGLDIDLTNTKKNIPNLKNLGAFKKHEVELYEFDQLEDNHETVKCILQNRRVDLCIDDGLHSDKSIINTAKSVEPFLSKNFIYIVEDHNNTKKLLKTEFPNWNTRQYGEISVSTLK